MEDRRMHPKQYSRWQMYPSYLMPFHNQKQVDVKKPLEGGPRFGVGCDLQRDKENVTSSLPVSLLDGEVRNDLGYIVATNRFGISGAVPCSTHAGFC